MKNTATQINNLFALAQGAPDEDVRTQALHTLWEIYGAKFLALVTKKSFKMDSDFDLNGYSFQYRQNSLAGNAFVVFRNAVLNFDYTRKVPFEAFIAKKAGWHVADEKRKNAKRSRREERESVKKDCGADKEEGETLSCVENCDVNPFTHEVNTIDISWEGRDLVARMRSKLAMVNPGLLRPFDAMYMASELNDYTDAAVGRALGCTRANVGVVRMKIREILVENGFEEEFHMLLAA